MDAFRAYFGYLELILPRLGHRQVWIGWDVWVRTVWKRGRECWYAEEDSQSWRAEQYRVERVERFTPKGTGRERSQGGRRRV